MISAALQAEVGCPDLASVVISIDLQAVMSLQTWATHEIRIRFAASLRVDIFEVL